MSQLDDAEIGNLLAQLRYEAPALDAIWQPGRRVRRRPGRLWLAGLVAAALVLAGGTAIAATHNWFAQFVPENACITGDPSCGADYHQVAIVINHVTDVVALNVLVKPNLGHERLSAIAAGVAAQQHARRVIVYLLDDLPQGPMVAGFPEIPADLAVPPPPPLAELVPYLRLTYDSGPEGAVSIWP